MQNQSNEKYPSNFESRKQSARSKMALFALSLFIASGVGIAKHEAIDNWFHNSIGYNSVDSNIDGPEAVANGLGKADVFDVSNLENLTVIGTDDENKPNKYLAHNGAEVNVYKVDDGKIPVLEPGADIRTAPLVGSGEDGIKTTIATLKEQVSLEGAKVYYNYSEPNGYGDSYFGFETSEIQGSLPNIDLDVENSVSINWVNAKEVSFVDKIEK